ncbi:MAG: MATE family efflux transporter, partial [Firmicutes bacterium]|nr:MATE family efflux transporter [Bacillota bacterium]
ISRQLGCGNQAKASQIASTALYSCLLSGAVIITLALLFLQPLLQLSGASVSILPYAKTYAPIYIIACIFNLFNVTMNNIVTSEGAARTTWRALLSGALLNIILDPLLIYSLNWGVAGAAVATAISQLFSSLIYLPIMQIGIPTMIFQLLGSLAITLINRQAQFYGDYAVAALGTVTRLLTIGSLMVFGFIKGFQPLAAYSYGAQNYNRLRNAIYTTTRWATFLCIAFSLIILIFASQIIAQFSGDNQQLQTLGIQALRINAISFLFFGFHTVYSCLFLALGQARTGFILGICRQGLCFLPLVWFLSRFYGLHGLIYAQPAADILTAFITLILAIHLHKKLPK